MYNGVKQLDATSEVTTRGRCNIIAEELPNQEVEMESKLVI